MTLTTDAPRQDHPYGWIEVRRRHDIGPNPPHKGRKPNGVLAYYSMGGPRAKCAPRANASRVARTIAHPQVTDNHTRPEDTALTVPREARQAHISTEPYRCYHVRMASRTRNPKSDRPPRSTTAAVHPIRDHLPRGTAVRATWVARRHNHARRRSASRGQNPQRMPHRFVATPDAARTSRARRSVAPALTPPPPWTIKSLCTPSNDGRRRAPR